MIRLLIVLVLFAMPAGATQDGWPALHDVVDVAANDALNIRAEPTVESAIIGTFAPNASGIEVIAPAPGADRWGIVNIGEQTGYVALRFLQRRPNTYFGSELPITTCYGTEPFWDVERAGGTLTYEDFGTGDSWSIAESPAQVSLSDRRVQVRVGRQQDRALTLFTRVAVGPQFCGDGMSDRTFGIDATLLVEVGDSTTLQTGCCSIAPN